MVLPLSGLVEHGYNTVGISYSKADEHPLFLRETQNDVMPPEPVWSERI
jgi:hypothetical protein